MKFAIKNGSVTLNGNTILEEIYFEINNNEHVAIVGRNGAGKSTLLKAIINNDLLDEGIGEDKFQIISIGNFKIGYMEQIEFNDENITLLSEIKKSFQELIDMEEKIDLLAKEMSKNNSDAIIKKYTDLQESFKLLGGYSYKKEYEVMLNKFGFTEYDQGKKISEFSGGQRTKIAFIKLLLSKPDLLILDEPTNHLDITTIEWLEDYLKEYKHALILVSHDRMFIDNIANIVYDIDYGRVIKYSGNYSKYEQLKRENANKLLKDYELQQKEIARLKTIYERFRSKPTKAKMALSKLHQIEKMDIIDKPLAEDIRTFKINLQDMEESVKKVLVAHDLKIGYDKPLAQLNLEIKRGSKIGVIGKNGTGKSTLLKTLNGILDPIDGNISYGLHVKTGYFDQNLAMIDSKQTVLKEFRDYLPDLEEWEARKALGSFLFRNDDVFKTIDVLSGGEKVRLQLCKILHNKPNFLILDEPTNHMDILSKEHLENILSDYKGTIIFVSHDRYFVKKIANQLLVFDENGEVEFYPYGYQEYIDNNKKIDNKNIKEVKEVKEQKVVEEVKSINKYELKKDLNKLEKEIINIETKIKLLEQELLLSDNYSDYAKANAINDKIKKYKEDLLILNEKWEELTDLLITN